MEELIDVIGPAIIAALAAVAIIAIATTFIFAQNETGIPDIFTLGDYIAQTIGSLFPGS